MPVYGVRDVAVAGRSAKLTAAAATGGGGAELTAAPPPPPPPALAPLSLAVPCLPSHLTGTTEPHRLDCAAVPPLPLLAPPPAPSTSTGK
jgi:hypothetical protein